MKPTLGRGDIVTKSKVWSEARQQKVTVALLVPIPSSDATYGHEEKNACAPDTHRISLCPCTQEWRKGVIIIEVSRRRPDQPTCRRWGSIDGHSEEFVGLLYGYHASFDGVERRYNRGG